MRNDVAEFFARVDGDTGDVIGYAGFIGIATWNKSSDENLNGKLK